MNDSLKNKRANREKSNANLKPFKPGESGNPKGRPKKEDSLADQIREYLGQQDLTVQEKRTYQDSIIRKATLQAVGGDHNARCWLADRAYGKAIDRIISRDGDAELTIE